MYTIRKLFKFEMAHQLNKAYSSCCADTVHGHSYVLELFITSKKLDETGMVMDFSKVKDLVKDKIDAFDHALVMPEDMPKEYLDALEKFNKNLILVKYNPTAENMAKDFHDKFRPLFPRNVKLKVRLHETTTGWAEYGK